MGLGCDLIAPAVNPNDSAHVGMKGGPPAQHALVIRFFVDYEYAHKAPDES